MTETMHPDSQAAVYQAAHTFVPQRLTIAREAAGLTQKALAARIETTASAISQFEGGSAKPRPENIARMALTLGVPPGFFAEPILGELIAPEACHFRSRRSTTKEEQRRVLARANMLVFLAQHLEESVQFPIEDIRPFKTTVDSDESIEAFAEQLREHWGLGYGPISDVATLVENRGAFVLHVDGHTTKLDAFSAWCGGRPFVFVTTDKGSASRRRFDVAHELGHLLIHESDGDESRHKEKQADRFASAFLLPSRSFSRECPRRLSWPHFRALKKRWKVSLAALIRRAFELELISEATYRRAYVQLNRMGWRKSEPDEPPMENGGLIVRAIELLMRQGKTLDRIAAAVCCRVSNIEQLLVAFRQQTTFAM